jgi:hypothetical protein
MLVAEFIGVVFSLVSRWYLTGNSNKARIIGFSVSIVAFLYWAVYYALAGMPWLMLNAIGIVGFSIRGLFNNKGESDSS